MRPNSSKAAISSSLNAKRRRPLPHTDVLVTRNGQFLFNPQFAIRNPHDTYGLGPASSLEDVVEFKYWFPTNAYFYLGMKRVSEALADIHHPEAERHCP